MMQNLLSEGANLTVDGFCACYAARAASDPSVTSLHKDVLSAINSTRDQTGLGVEDAVDHIEQAKEDPAEFNTFTMQQLDDVGDYLQELATGMAEAGTCPAGE